jgi:hypothetical protein
LFKALLEFLKSFQIAQRAIWHLALIILALFSSAVPFLALLFYPICAFLAVIVTKNLGNTQDPPPRNYRELLRILTAVIVAAMVTLFFLTLFRETLDKSVARTLWTSSQVLPCFFIEIRFRLKMHLLRQT